MNIYLIGYRATGKTTIGRRLAEKMDLCFIDSDALIEETLSMPISGIVVMHGWEGFRQMESAAISALSGKEGLIVATGGGVVLDPDNVARLRQTGTVVWLDASPATIVSRMASDPATAAQRPPLTQNAPSIADEVHETLQHRRPLYRDAAHIHITTDNTTTEALCDHILSLLP